jgi:restriction system protein
MPIPDFQSLMLPLLQHFADGKEHANQETLDTLAGLLQLTAAERVQLLPSGKQALFTNRLAWAKSQRWHRRRTHHARS